MDLQRSSCIYEEFYYSMNHFRQGCYLKIDLIGLEDSHAKDFSQMQAMGKAIVKLAELVWVITKRIDLVMNSLMAV